MFDDEELALIEAIHSDPKDDGVRLAYSDWLEANGEPLHAEFIRIQCQEPYFIFAYYMVLDGPYPNRFATFTIDDPAVIPRFDRLTDIIAKLKRTARYAFETNHFWLDLHYRGLPLKGISVEGETEDQVWDKLGHLSRVDLTIRTDRLAEALAHPLMARVDKLHIWPETSWEADFEISLDPHYDRFWAENIPVLAASPVIDRLVELRLCACRSSGEQTEQSNENMALSRELLEPRVHVTYHY